MAYVHPAACILSFGANTAGLQAFGAAKKVTLKETSNNPAFATSGTSNEKTRVGGRKDWTLTIEANAEAGDLTPGSLTKGYTTCFKLEVGAAADYYSGYGVVTSIDSNVDIESGDPVSFTINIEGNGVLFKSTTAG